MERMHLDRDTLAALLQVSDFTAISYKEIVELFTQEKLSQKLPEGTFSVDPRNGDRIIYHASRSIRPHDNLLGHAPDKSNSEDCTICRGETTGIVDVADLSEGFTFINKNLFPVLYPFEELGESVASASGCSASGLHFLQWTSSYHDRDWHNMPLKDCTIVMQRLAALEKKLIEGTLEENLTFGKQSGHTEEAAYVLIIKNYGNSVGASLAHGHQQVLLSNIAPNRTDDHIAFQVEQGEKLAAYILRETPSELWIKDYGRAILIVPYFMRRPYEMFLVLKDASKQYLHELSPSEIEAVANGWHDVTWLFHHIMPGLGKEIAYNVAALTGPGTGIYFEFLPYTQPMGGLERMGLYVCQNTPRQAAEVIRGSLSLKAESSDS